MGQKINSDATASEKIIGLYGLLLFTSRQYSLTELADKFRCSKQTVLRMVKTIERTHTLNILSEMREGNRWFWIDAPKQRLKISLRPQDIRYLNLCKDMVGEMLPSGIRTEIEHAIEISESLLPSKAKSADKNEFPISTATTGIVDYSPHQSIIETLLRCIEEKLVCIISYCKAGDQESHERHYAPDRLRTTNNSLYVEGWSVKSGNPPEMRFEQTLAVQRITDIRVTDKNFDFASPLPTVQKYFGFGFDEPFTVKAKVHGYAMNYVAERVWSSDQEVERIDKDTIVITFTAQSRVEVVTWILSFGDRIELLEPAELRGEILEKITRILSKYNQD